MRRASAMLLLALFGFSLISPSVFALGADSKLPACCRRDGKHHCATMATESESSSGPALQAGRCSFFPTGAGVPASRTVALAGISQAGFEQPASHEASAHRTETFCHSSYSRAGQKRGPPTLLS
jgi:hypothetical protein